MIVRWRCDIQMAEKKGIKATCNKKCHECLCGIGMDEWGSEKHRSDMPEGCANVVVRNFSRTQGNDPKRRGRPMSSGGKRL